MGPKNVVATTSVVATDCYVGGMLVRALLLEAVAAIHRLVTARLERHFSGTATGRACCGEHLALAAATCCAAGLAGSAAIGATVGLVLKTLLCVEFLLTGSKRKLCAAIDARQ